MKWRVMRHSGGSGEMWCVANEHDFEEEARGAYAFIVSELRQQGGVRLVTPTGEIKASVWKGPREPAHV